MINPNSVYDLFTWRAASAMADGKPPHSIDHFLEMMEDVFGPDSLGPPEGLKELIEWDIKNRAEDFAELEYRV